MEYYEAANFLFDLRRFQIRPGTESAAALRSELGEPGADIRFVQVAGSNGKGSTAKMVESMLREAGLSVGLYSSPHLETLDERIRVDGRPITTHAITEFVEQVKPWLVDRAAAGNPLTFFEVVTLLGIWYFDREEVDVAVLEVGLGGEFDATSVVDPIASCVTTVSLEHTSVLGDTIEEIATTKAKVAPADGTPLVTGANGTALVAIREVVGDVLRVGTDDDAGIVAGDADTTATDGVDNTDITVSYEGRITNTESKITLSSQAHNAVGANAQTPFVDGLSLSARLPLLGEHQALNAGIATTLAGQVVESINADPSEESTAALDAEAISRGLRNAHWPGRFEVITSEPLTVLDGAHNPQAIETLSETLSTFEYDDLHLVFGAMHDKSHREMVEALPPADSVITCRPDLDRAEDPAVLARVFEQAGVDSVTGGESVADAFGTAQRRADADDCILVTGSLFAVGEARTTLTRLQIPKRITDETTADGVLESAHAIPETVENHRESAVHHTITTQVDDRQATVLDRELTRLGGDCVVSAVRTAGERKRIVLMGSTAEFRELSSILDNTAVGLPAVAEELRTQVGLTTETPAEQYPWDSGPAVMGILNVTPDSFYDGGDFFDAEAAIEQAKTLVEAGADIIDVGGESTRPGAEPVPAAEEIDRVVPVIDAIAELDVSISVDTRKATVAEAALNAGADILNDVTGLADPAMRFLAADREVPVIVMHSIDAPVIPDKRIDYDDVVEDVIRALNERLVLAEKAGIPRERIIVDPGIGFGKTSGESFELLGRLSEFDALGCSVLVGHSRKSMFSRIDSEPEDRLAATVAATALAADRGADIVRVHDVAENRAAVDVVTAVTNPDSLDP